MGKITVLSPQVVAKIAAGEVIARPASVVKELLENSLDAGATQIDIELYDAGFRKIVVTDNGSGMDPEDLALCFQAHATSKLVLDTDLEAVTSLGFRGEALSSIAAISSLTIQSRPHQQRKGYGLTVMAGHTSLLRPLGMPPGTRVIVDHLFSATPVRKKFMKKGMTEVRHSVDVVMHAAIAFPAIGFSLTHNGQAIVILSHGQTPLQRIEQAMGDRIAGQLLPLSASAHDVHVSGFIGKPHSATKSKTRQFVMINNRSVKNTDITDALQVAYGTLIMRRLHSICMLWITVPPAMVDANVHPQKREVTLQDSEQVIDLIQEVVRKTLKDHDVSYRQTDSILPRIHDGGIQPYTPHILRDAAPKLWSVADTSVDDASPIIQVKNLYLITTVPEGILLIDQHAAHESILYHQLNETVKVMEKKRDIQVLATPHVFDLPSHEAVFLTQSLTVFRNLGFEIDVFGKHSFKVSTIPKIVVGRNISKLITDLLDDVMHDNKIQSFEHILHHVTALIACKTAIKSGQPLGPEERKRLVEKVINSPHLITCPHGRPLKLLIGLSDLHRMFKRQ